VRVGGSPTASSGDRRDLALSYARGAINETKLLALGQRLAAHACFKYSRARRTIRAGIDMLRGQASSHDGALAALESKTSWTPDGRYAATVTV
jgi:hypothetical protein